jgi:hypothetical protein
MQLLSGCSSPILSPDMNRVKGESLAYQDGYKAGCHSGFLAGGSLVHSFKRDVKRIGEDEQYKLGWKKAYRDCKSDFREMCKSKALVSKADLYCTDVWQQGLDEEE